MRSLPPALVVVVALALVVRVLAVAATDAHQPTGDPADYDRHAVSLVESGTFAPTAFAEPGGASALRQPAYPVLLAGVYAVTGARWTAGRLAGALLGALTVGLLFVLARRLAGESVARWSAGLAAVFPPLVALSTALLAEALFLPLLLGAVLCLLALHDRLAVRWALAAGALIGLAALTRGNGIVLLVPGLLAVATAAGATPWRRRAATAAAMLAATALVLAPWTVRNVQAFGALLPLGTQSGYALGGQYNAEAARDDDFYVAWRVPQTVPDYAGLFGRPGLDEAAVQQELTRRARAFAADHPGYVADVLVTNTLRIFDLGPGHGFVSGGSFTEMGIPPRFQGETGLAIRLLLLLALAGTVVLARRRRLPGPAFVWVVPVLLLASVVCVGGAPRYRTPIDPFAILLASVALVALRAPLAARRPAARRVVRKARALGTRLAGLPARRPAAVAAAVVVASLALSLVVRTQAFEAGLWIDDAQAVGIASQPFADIPATLRQDGAPPLYYLLLSLWIDVAGPGERALYTLSLLFALAAVGAGLWAGRVAFGLRAGLICAVLVATTPLLTSSAQQARMYSLQALLSLLATGAFVEAFVHRRRGFLVAFAGVLAVMVYTHYWSLYLGAGAAAAVAWLVATSGERRALARDAVLAFGAVGLLFAPWAPTLLFQAAHTAAPWADPTEVSDVLQIPAHVLGVGLLAPVLLAAAAGLARMLRGRGVDRTAVAALALATLVTIAIAWAASVASPNWAPRYLAVLLGPLLVLTAAGLSRVGALGVVALVLFLPGMAGGGAGSEDYKSNARRVFTAVAPAMRPGDLAISTQPEQVPVAAYYLPPGVRYRTPYGPVADPRVMDWRDAVDRLRAATPERHLAPTVARLSAGQRLLVIEPIIVGEENWRSTWNALVKRRTYEWRAALRRDARLQRLGSTSISDGTVVYSGVQVTLYERRPVRGTAP